MSFGHNTVSHQLLINLLQNNGWCKKLRRNLEKGEVIIKYVSMYLEVFLQESLNLFNYTKFGLVTDTFKEMVSHLD